MDIEIVDIEEASYSIGRLSAKKQFHVSRRLGPFLGAITPHIKALLDKKKPTLDKFFDIIPDVVDILAEMKDEECDYVIDTCLAVVKFKQEKNWAQITNPSGGFQFDIDMMRMLRLTAEVVRVNLAAFFPTGLLEESEGELK